jgi:hypothetical protein
VSFRDGANVATASAAHKHAPSDAYELEDLDEDWVAMLNVLDNRLLEVRLRELNYTLVLLCAASSNRLSIMQLHKKEWIGALLKFQESGMGLWLSDLWPNAYGVVIQVWQH